MHVSKTLTAAASGVAACLALLLTGCDSEGGAAVAVACADPACLRERGYECAVMATDFLHCTCSEAACASVEEYVCMDASCVVKPFEGPVTGALLQSLDPGIYGAGTHGG